MKVEIENLLEEIDLMYEYYLDTDAIPEYWEGVYHKNLIKLAGLVNEIRSQEE